MVQLILMKAAAVIMVVVRRTPWFDVRLDDDVMIYDVLES